MKFRALNVNYYNEADVFEQRKASREDCFLIAEGSYIANILLIDQPESSDHGSCDNDSTVLLHTKAIVSDVDFNLDERKCRNSLITVSGVTVVPQYILVLPCRNDKFRMSMKQNHANVAFSRRHFFCTKSSKTFFSMVSYIVYTILQMCTRRKQYEYSGHDVTTTRTYQKRLLTCIANVRSTTCKSRVKGNMVDVGTLISVRATGTAKSQLIENCVRFLAQLIIAFTQNRQLRPFLITLCSDTSVSPQSGVWLFTQPPSVVSSPSDSSTHKRKRGFTCTDEITSISKRPSYDLIPHHHDESYLGIESGLPTRMSYHDRSVVVGKKIPKSARKDRKAKRKSREKQRHLKSGVYHIAGSMSPALKQKWATERSIDDGDSQVHLQSIVESLATNKSWTLGNVDIELNTARNNMSYKALSSRNAFAETKIPISAAPAISGSKLRMNWTPWNAFRQEPSPPAHHNSCFQKYNICPTTKPEVVEEHWSSLRHDLSDNNNRLSRLIVKNGKFKKKQSANMEENGNKVLSIPAFHIQSTGENCENPIQRSQNHCKIVPEQFEPQHSHHTPFSHRKVLCSESFLESWGDVVAAIASSEWMTSSSFESPNAHTDGTNWGKISVIDSPLLNGSGIDIETSSNCCFLVISASLLQTTEKTKEVVLKLAELAALGRYKKCFVFFYIDNELSPLITKHMIKIQFAIATLPVHVVCKTATFNNLAASLAHSILHLPEPHPIDDRINVVKDRLTLDRMVFLISLLPVASVGGSIECVTLTKSLLPIGSPYFEMLLKNQRLRQKIMMMILCRETIDDLNPKMLVQLSYALGLGRQIDGPNPTIVMTAPIF